MKYFYTIGEYTRNVSPKSKFSHWGLDARSWVLSSEVKEVSKEAYDRIVEDDKKIVQKYKELYGIVIETHHKPFCK